MLRRVVDAVAGAGKDRHLYGRSTLRSLLEDGSSTSAASSACSSPRISSPGTMRGRAASSRFDDVRPVSAAPRAFAGRAPIAAALRESSATG
jgi:hypothetical protein